VNIVVCLKQVPGVTQVKVDPQTGALVRPAVKPILNPLDTYALEEGVRLKERFGGTVIGLTMGPPQAVDMLREAISVGADEVILLSDAALADSDTLATAAVLALAIRKIGSFGLVICGRQALDGDTGQVGPQLAEMLGLPFIAYVSKVEEATATTLRLQRAVDEGKETIEAPLPAVITVVKEINNPRLFSLRGLQKAKTVPVPVWTAGDIGADPAAIGSAGSATRIVKYSVPERARRGEVLQGELAEQLDALVTRLKEAHLA